MNIDSHHHFWHYDPDQYRWIGPEMAVLKNDFLPEELLAETVSARIDGVVSVQARQTVDETRWLIDLAGQHDLIRGVVGWVPLASPDLDRTLDEFTASPWLKAVRHVVQDEPDDAFILGDDFNRGISRLQARGLVYDILIYAKHLPNTTKFVDAHADQPFVLDHIAKPTIAASQFDHDWAENLKQLARRPHVVCKFSGAATEVRDADWTIETLRPYWDVALEAFGPARLMFGSDWPVCLLRTAYERWFATVRSLAAELSESERQELFGGTACRVYGIT